MQERLERTLLELRDALVDEVTERVVRRIVADPPASLRRTMMDIFDRIAAAIQAKNSGDNAAYDTHLAAIESHLSQLDTEESGDQTSIAGIEAGLSKIADAVNPPPAPASLTVSPSSISGAVGAGLTASLTVSGGVAPYSFSSSLGDVSVDSSGNVSGTPATAETGTITVTDSSSPPLTETVPVTIS